MLRSQSRIIAQLMEESKLMRTFLANRQQPKSSDDVLTLPAIGSRKGRVLYSYVADYLRYTPEEAARDTHGSIWRIREIARLFTELGYDVDAINWFNHSFRPQQHYDIVWDIDANLSFWADIFDERTLRLMHLTTSDPFYQNTAELQRIYAVNHDRNGRCNPQRQHKHPDRIRHSLHLADRALLLGTPYTLRTYPQRYHDKIDLIGVTGSLLGDNVKTSDQLVPAEREFLWYFGSGAIHKGLDLVLEAFAQNPQFTLNVVGGINTEKDFVSLYRHELYELPNIHYHGRMQPHGAEFGQLIQRCFAFIAPSCSESISSAAVTCLQLGMYPIVSRDTGVDLPADAGIYLESLDAAEIDQAIHRVMQLTDAELYAQLQTTQSQAMEDFSRSRHLSTIKAFIQNQISRHQAKFGIELASSTPG